MLDKEKQARMQRIRSLTGRCCIGDIEYSDALAQIAALAKGEQDTIRKAKTGSDRKAKGGQDRSED